MTTRTHPTPPGKHAGTIRRLRKQIEPRMPSGLGAYGVSSIAMPLNRDNVCTPDLVVLPDTWDHNDEWLADPSHAELAVEVISQSEKAKEIAEKNNWYALAGVRHLLVVDPRRGVWTFYTHPGEGRYQGTLHGKFGEDIPLPEPFGFTLDTSCLPLYEETK